MKKNIIAFLINLIIIIGLFYVIRMPNNKSKDLGIRLMPSTNSIPISGFDKMIKGAADAKFQGLSSHSNMPSGKRSNRNSGNTVEANPFESVNADLGSNRLFSRNSKSKIKNQKNNNQYTLVGINNGQDIQSSHSAFGMLSVNMMRGTKTQQNQSNTYNTSISNQLAYNNLSKPRMTLGGGNEGDEDPFNSGGGDDNEMFYNDVPVGSGTLSFLILILGYMLRVYVRKR